MIAATLVISLAAQAQQPPAPAPAPPAAAPPAAVPPGNPLLTVAQLEVLVTPLAGVPQQMLPAVLDACRYPADILDAEATISRPQGAVKGTWNTGVQFLARYSPDLLGVLARDIGATAALGEAYTRQPNDVLRAYGAVELRTRTPPHPAPARAAQTPVRPPTQTVLVVPATTQPPRQPCGSNGGPLHGAARGAAGGAMIGAIAGNAGRGAAYGSAAGGFASMLRRAAMRREGACY